MEPLIEFQTNPLTFYTVILRLQRPSPRRCESHYLVLSAQPQCLGHAPLPSSKKKLPEFDSFRLPPPSHKKGMKPVQAPGPYLSGSGLKYVTSRQEIMGEPLTQEEIKKLIQSCLKSRRQLNTDLMALQVEMVNLTHNMSENTHDSLEAVESEPDKMQRGVRS